MLLVLASVLGPARRASGQAFVVRPEQMPLVDLSAAEWRFQPGDDPRWASPQFDDSSWPLLRGDAPWDAQGYPGLSGMAWYRLRVRLPAAALGPLSVAPGAVADHYQVYADGQLVGQWGPVPSPTFIWVRHELWSVVAPVAAPGTELVLALRVYHWPKEASYMSGGFRGGPVLLGRPAAVAERVHLARTEALVRILPAVGLALLCLVVGVFALLLYGRDRAAPEYLWFGVLVLSFVSATGKRLLFDVWLADRYSLGDVFPNLGIDVGHIALIFLFFRFLGVPLTRTARWLVIVAVPLTVYDMLEAIFYFAGVPGWNVQGLVVDLVYYLFVVGLVVRYWPRSRAARQFALPLVFLVFGNLYIDLSWALRSLHLSRHGATDLLDQPVSLQWVDVGELLFVAAMAWLLMDQFAENQRERSRLTAEIEAARSVQQVLVPSEADGTNRLPEIPGLAIESVYRPAQVVGGDFFQVIPVANGAALVVLGDVSGKGLQAAMTVSLVVGALRTFAETVSSPAELLRGLNRRLHGRGSGFTTCLALHLSPGGEVLLSNAGHLPPYRNGREMAVEAGLPLGLVEAATYQDAVFSLAVDDRLMLLTDGVVESANRAKELFGFVRTEALSDRPAAEIVEAAMRFAEGQSQADDVTVLTVRRC